MPIKFKFLAFLFISIFFCGFSTVLAADNFNLGLEVYTCAVNGTCDAGETTANCPLDCPAEVCGNGIIEGSEQCDNSVGNGSCPASCSLACTSNGSCSSGETHNFTITNISFTSTTDNSAQISWLTSYPATCNLSWDLSVNNNYSLGYSQEISGYNQTNHVKPLTGLLASTTYYFKIDCTDTSFYSATVGGNSFVTLASSVDVTPPGSVSGLTATPGDRHIYLAWTNPSDLDFAGVVIRRSNSSTPALNDGVEVFRGEQSNFDDTGLVNGLHYYYSVFAFDNAPTPNYSGGVGVSATPRRATSTLGNVTGLRIVPGEGELTLYWTQPPDIDFLGVVINRSVVGFPGFTGGTKVLEGTGYPVGTEFSFTDSGLTSGLLYYYRVFAYRGPNDHASGVSISGVPVSTTPPTATTTPPTTTSTPPGATSSTPSQPGVGGSTGSETSTLPGAPSTQELSFKDFNFFQNNQLLSFANDDAVAVVPGQEILINLSDNKIPAGTEKIVLNLSINNQIQSYLFQSNPASGGYQASVPGFGNEGKYWVTILVLDKNSQVIKNVYGWFDVKNAQIIELPTIITSINEQIIQPIAESLKPAQEIAKSPAGQATAVVVAVSSVANLAIAIPWWNLWTLLQFMFTQPVLLYFRRKSWGTIYNSITKKPIDLALVRLYDAKTNQLVVSRVTDRAGRYSFLVDPGEYYLRVEKPQFEFPSGLLKHAPDDGNFIDLYYGDKIVVTHEGRSAIIANIPVDPTDVKLSDAEIIRQLSKEKLTRYLSWVGPILAVIYFALFPSIYSGGIVAVHFVIRLIFGRLVRKRTNKYWGVVFDQKQNKPIKNAITRVYSSEYGRMLEFYVTDRRGRYNFLVGENKYYVTGDKEGYSTAKTPIIDLSKNDKESAFIARDLSLSPLESSNDAVAPEPPVASVTQPDLPQAAEADAPIAVESATNLAEEVVKSPSVEPKNE